MKKLKVALFGLSKEIFFSREDEKVKLFKSKYSKFSLELKRTVTEFR